MNIQMEEIHRVCGVGWSFQALPGPTVLPVPVCVHQPRNSPNPILLAFLGRLPHLGMINLSIPFLAPLQRIQGRTEYCKLVIWLALSGDQPSPKSLPRFALLEQKMLLSPRKLQEVLRALYQALGAETNVNISYHITKSQLQHFLAL